MLRVNTLGDETILVVPKDSSASNSILRAAVENVLIIPIPLVAPVKPFSVTVPAAAPSEMPPGVVDAPPSNS